MGYEVGPSSSDSVVQNALDTAREGVSDIDDILRDIRGNTGDVTDSGDKNVIGETYNGAQTKGGEVMDSYGVHVGTGGLQINSAAGAMVVDDLMQKISTKVQVAAQLLSATNNMNKTASRIMSQG
jgi:hypothetical protein